MSYFSSGTLAQVATILAKEYGVRVHIGGSQAYTSRDVNSKWYINIPALATNDPFYIDIMRCYLDHEAGHVRFSDMDMLEHERDKMTYMLKSVWNIFEDVYVERKMSRSFPGCARNLRVGAERIFSGERDVPEDAACAILNYILMLARYNVGKSPVFDEGVKTSGENIPDDLKQVIAEHVDKLPTCNSTKATYDLAQQLVEALKKYVKDNATEEEKGSGDGAPQDGEAGDDDADLGDIPFDIPGAGKGDVPSDMSGSGKEDKPADGGGSGGGAASRGLGDYDLKEALLEAIAAADSTDDRGYKSYEVSDRVNRILNKVTSEFSDILSGYNNEWTIYRTLDELIKGHRGDYVGKMSDDDRNDAMKESAKLSSQLAGLLQTIVMNRGGFATRGKLDPRRIARIAVGRPDIFSSRVDKKGLDTEVILSVDFSGSMGSRRYVGGRAVSTKSKLLVANQALMSILTALKGIQGVRSMAYMYSDFVAHVCSFSDAFTKNSRMVVRAAGGTPTGDAVQHAMTLFSPNAKRKILLLLTDGEPDDRDYFRASLNLLKKQNIEVVGIGILDDSLYSDMGEDEHIIVNDLQELTPKLFKILRDKLVRSA